jgi:hypothetical protein
MDASEFSKTLSSAVVFSSYSLVETKYAPRSARKQIVEVSSVRPRETCTLSQGVQAGRKALRTSRINGMEVRTKRTRGVFTTVASPWVWFCKKINI